MDVLTGVDDARIRGLLSGQTFFWLDMVDPAPGELDSSAT